MRLELGKSLQWLRKSRSLTQFQLASLAQIDYRHYQNIESGRVEVKLETLSRICSSMSCDLTNFFKIIEKQPWLKEKLQIRNYGNELYFFFLSQEQSKFTLYKEVREILIKWGFPLAQLARGELESAPFYCVELNSQEQVVWQNLRIKLHHSTMQGQSLERVLALFFNDSHEVGTALSLQLREATISSCYYEAVLDHKLDKRLGFFVFFALKQSPLSENQNVCLVFLEVKEGMDDFIAACRIMPQLRASLTYGRGEKASF